MSDHAAISSLLAEGPRVLNVGVRTFTEALEMVGASYLHVNWHPPAGADAELGRLLAVMLDEDTPDSIGARIKAANEQAIARILSADPVWVDVRPAREIWPEME